LIGLALTDAHGIYMATAECHGCPICQLVGLCGWLLRSRFRGL